MIKFDGPLTIVQSSLIEFENFSSLFISLQANLDRLSKDQEEHRKSLAEEKSKLEQLTIEKEDAQAQWKEEKVSGQSRRVVLSDLARYIKNGHDHCSVDGPEFIHFGQSTDLRSESEPKFYAESESGNQNFLK